MAAEAIGAGALIKWLIVGFGGTVTAVLGFAFKKLFGLEMKTQENAQKLNDHRLNVSENYVKKEEFDKRHAELRDDMKTIVETVNQTSAQVNIIHGILTSDKK